MLLTVGDRGEAYWPGDSQNYAGTVNGVDGNAQQITYDDSDVENLALENEQ